MNKMVRHEHSVNGGDLMTWIECENGARYFVKSSGLGCDFHGYEVFETMVYEDNENGVYSDAIYFDSYRSKMDMIDGHIYAAMNFNPDMLILPLEEDSELTRLEYMDTWRAMSDNPDDY